MEKEEGGGGEDEDDREVVLLALTVLHRLLSPEDSSLTPSIGICGTVKTKNCPRKLERVTKVLILTPVCVGAGI